MLERQLTTLCDVCGVWCVRCGRKVERGDEVIPLLLLLIWWLLLLLLRLQSPLWVYNNTRYSLASAGIVYLV